MSVHEFDNGLKVLDAHLIELQVERYKLHNVHEAEEEEIFRELIEEMDSGACFVNVGAAIGYYSILAKLLRPDVEVIAYEPLRRHAEFLRQNMRLNGLSRGDISVYRQGVAGMDGYSEFWVGDFSSMIVGEEKEASLINAIRAIFDPRLIRTVSLQTVCKRIQSDIGLLQMDIQGAERVVLESAKPMLQAHSIRRILLGTHAKDIHAHCGAILRECGYEIVLDNGDTQLQPDGILAAIARP